MTRSSLFRAAALVAVAAPLSMAAAQTSDVSVSPFVTLLPATGASPLAGLALTMAGNGGLTLRVSGHVQLDKYNNNSLNSPGSFRPWGGDADAVLFLGGRGYNGSRYIAPYVFAGIGAAGRDSLGSTIVRNNWSYGAGLSIPLFNAVDAFGESRWRMSRFVLPTAQFAPRPTNEIRFGLSFHLSNGSRAMRSKPSSLTCREKR